MSTWGICKFFNSPGGCRRDTSCSFSHQTQANTTNRWSNLTTKLPASTWLTNPSPPGTCKFFWGKGHCRYRDCKFRHSTSPTSPTSSISESASSNTSFSAVTTHSSAFTSPFKDRPLLNPASAMRALESYSDKRDGALTHVGHLYKFNSILASCNEENKWVGCYALVAFISCL